ncbi:MAG TPA: 5-(carboxyamino)imidazole ribonucleotide synthase [Bacteroidia bacterium]|nr:5-(carboxyamino)imidazole ribonucleotide synthase [Bacteroidia bacterium]
MSFKTTTLGILGGGQLGKMLIQEAVNLNIELFVLDPDQHAPCKHLVPHFTCGSLQDFDTVYAFGKQVEVLTIEIEHVNVEALFKLEGEGVKVFPQPKVLQMVQDKGAQKLFYQEHDIPTAAFHLVQNKEKAKMLWQQHSIGFMQKLRKGGYDGKGVTKINSEFDFENAFDAPSVMEELVDFEKEIAVIVARNANSEVVVYDVVEMDFNPQQNLVEFLQMPAKLDKSVELAAKEIALKVAEKAGIIGILAVEMFLTKDKQILVNEIAPRAHNSGHQTIECCRTSQYAQQLRAVLNLPLGSTSCHTPSIMVNLLGEAGKTGDAIYEGLEEVLKLPNVYVHLYGKKITKPYRKMGHVTILHEKIEEAIKNARLIQNTLKVTSL